MLAAPAHPYTRALLEGLPDHAAAKAELSAIPGNATGLVFGKNVQESLGPAAYILGTGIHLVFALAWAGRLAHGDADPAGTGDPAQP